ncbi:MAG: pyrimidine/purine nucleotide monophosphate nucleosidase domain-containing protein [Candidatus Peribacteraceae bacterium]|jgi:hypothetical protein
MSDPLSTTVIIPDDRLAQLEEETIASLQDMTGEDGDVRRSILAILAAQDLRHDPACVEENYPDFRYNIAHSPRGIALQVENAPGVNFREGGLLLLRRKQIGAAIRSLILQHQLHLNGDPQSRTQFVHRLLQEEGILEPVEVLVDDQRHAIENVLVWGSHKPQPEDYDYSVEIGEECGHQFLRIVNGCGPGTMRGSSKGNGTGFRDNDLPGIGSYGYSCTEIIAAAEPPNKYLQRLVLLPTTETRIEAFLRTSHGVAVLPGGAGTLEEFFMLLSTKLHERNRGMPLPTILTAPRASQEFVTALDTFIRETAGPEAQKHYETVIHDPIAVSRKLREGAAAVRTHREQTGQPPLWNRELYIPPECQEPFETTHESVEALRLTADQPVWQLMDVCRRVCKSIVRGTIISDYVAQVRERGRYRLRGDRNVLVALDNLLKTLARQGRLGGMGNEQPCYTINQ